MLKPLPLFIGLRYTRAKRKNHFISFISLISMLGMILGVAVLIVVLSVMNGFDRELRERILGMVPHATISHPAGIADWESMAEQAEQDPAVVATAPYIRGEGMISSSRNKSAALITGILPERERQVSIIADHMQAGSLEDLKPGSFGVVLGELLARNLGVGVGDKVVVLLPDPSVSVAGALARFKRLEVTGIFKVGAELDASIAFVHIEDAEKLFRLQGKVEGIRLKLHDLFEARSTAWRIANSLEGDYWFDDWTRTQGNLFQAIKLEKTMIGLLLLMIIAVAAFNIISTLVMVVTDKQADIAILRTMGASPRTIMGIFIIQGSVIGVVGCTLGVLLGVLLALSVSDIVGWIETTFGVQVLNADVYFISYLPSQLLATDVFAIAIAALSMSFLATIYPSMRAAKTQPAEALRYE